MGEWRETQLGSVLKVKHGYAFRGAEFSDDPQYPTLVTPGNFEIGGGFKVTKPKTFTGDYSDEFVLAPGDVVVTMTDLSRATDTLGYSATIPNDGRTYLHNQRIGKISITDTLRADPMFMAYVLRGRAYRHHVVGGASGSTVKHTSPGRIESFTALLPPLGEQKRIAAVLDAFNDLIETNRQQIQSARALSRDLYAQAADEQHAVPFGDVASLVRAGAKVGDIDPHTPYIALEHFATDGGGLQAVGDASGIDSNKSRFLAGDVLYGKLRPYFRKFDRPGFDGVCSTEIWVLRAKAPYGAATLDAIVSQPAFTDYAMAGSGGTRMPRADWKHVSTMPTPVPPEAIRDELNDSLERLWQVSVDLSAEIADLTRARDELLPLLMSGKVRVDESLEVV